MRQKNRSTGSVARRVEQKRLIPSVMGFTPINPPSTLIREKRGAHVRGELARPQLRYVRVEWRQCMAFLFSADFRSVKVEGGKTASSESSLADCPWLHEAKRRGPYGGRKNEKKHSASDGEAKTYC